MPPNIIWGNFHVKRYDQIWTCFYTNLDKIGPIKLKKGTSGHLYRMDKTTVCLLHVVVIKLLLLTGKEVSVVSDPQIRLWVYNQTIS